MCMGVNKAIHGWSSWNSVQRDVEVILLRRVLSYFTLKVFGLLMLDITHKAIHVLKSIDTFGIFNGHKCQD